MSSVKNSIVEIVELAILLLREKVEGEELAPPVADLEEGLVLAETVLATLKSTSQGSTGTQTTFDDDLFSAPSKEDKPAEKRVVDPSPDNPGRKIALRVLQDRLTEVVDAHIREVQPAIDRLGCGGDCYACPNPDGYSEVQFQVGACLKNVVEGLDLDRRFLTDEAQEEDEEDNAED